MPREPREFRTLDKDLSRVTNAERAVMQSARPLLRLGIALLFVIAAALTATGFFAGQPAIAIVAVGMAVAAYLALSIGARALILTGCCGVSTCFRCTCSVVQNSGSGCKPCAPGRMPMVPPVCRIRMPATMLSRCAGVRPGPVACWPTSSRVPVRRGSGCHSPRWRQ